MSKPRSAYKLVVFWVFTVFTFPATNTLVAAPRPLARQQNGGDGFALILVGKDILPPDMKEHYVQYRVPLEGLTLNAMGKLIGVSGLSSMETSDGRHMSIVTSDLFDGTILVTTGTGKKYTIFDVDSAGNGKIRPTTIAELKEVSDRVNRQLAESKAIEQIAQNKAAQQRLQSLGLDPGATDGVITSKTIAALKKFQAEHQLPITGTLNQKTLTALMGGNTDVSVVRNAQERLISIGYDAGPTNGVMTPQTEAAIKKFQAQHLDADGNSLAITGVLDDKTLAVLLPSSSK